MILRKVDIRLSYDCYMFPKEKITIKDNIPWIKQEKMLVYFSKP